MLTLPRIRHGCIAVCQAQFAAGETRATQQRTTAVRIATVSPGALSHHAQLAIPAMNTGSARSAASVMPQESTANSQLPEAPALLSRLICDDAGRPQAGKLQQHCGRSPTTGVVDSAAQHTTQQMIGGNAAGTQAQQAASTA
jgi:hypothetical protein